MRKGTPETSFVLNRYCSITNKCALVKEESIWHLTEWPDRTFRKTHLPLPLTRYQHSSFHSFSLLDWFFSTRCQVFDTSKLDQQGRRLDHPQKTPPSLDKSSADENRSLLPHFLLCCPRCPSNKDSVSRMKKLWQLSEALIIIIPSFVAFFFVYG